MNSLPVSMTLPGEGKVLRAMDDELTVLLSGEQTGGAFTMVQVVTPPGGGPPPHCHSNEDEWFHVLEGRAELWQEGAWSEVPAGTSIFLPRGIPHTYRNCGDTPLRMIVHAAPSGFERFYERFAAACAEPGGPDPARLAAIAAEHGIRFLPPDLT